MFLFLRPKPLLVLFLWRVLLTDTGGLFASLGIKNGSAQGKFVLKRLGLCHPDNPGSFRRHSSWVERSILLDFPWCFCCFLLRIVEIDGKGFLCVFDVVVGVV